MPTTTHRMIQQMNWAAINQRPTPEQADSLPEPFRAAVLKVLGSPNGTVDCEECSATVGPAGAILTEWRPTVFRQQIGDPDKVDVLCDSLDCLHLSHDEEWEQI